MLKIANLIGNRRSRLEIARFYFCTQTCRHQTHFTLYLFSNTAVPAEIFIVHGLGQSVSQCKEIKSHDLGYNIFTDSAYSVRGS